MSSKKCVVIETIIRIARGLVGMNNDFGLRSENAVILSDGIEDDYISFNPNAKVTVSVAQKSETLVI